MKILKYIIYTIVLLLGVKFAQVLIVNGFFMNHYNAHNYQISDLDSLGFLNIQQPYILHYNRGNAAFKSGDYATAVSEYQSALGLFPSRARVCDIRVNLGLSQLELLDYDVENQKDLADFKSSLVRILEMLYKDECVNSEGTGRSEDAETLKQDIEIYLAILERAQDNAQKNDDKKKDDEKQQDSEQSSKEDELKSRTDSAKEEKSKEEAEFESLENYSYYDGIRW